MEKIINSTLDYYNQGAQKFTDGTQSIDFKETQNKFLNRLPEGATILDFGCGSGRDTKYFLDKGYKVDAIDGSEELCKIASEYTGIKVKKTLFEELCEINKYDGIWACSSILHLPKDQLMDVLHKMLDATKNNGYIYTSFKYGDYEGFRNERYFTDFTEELFSEFIKEISSIHIIECWITNDVRPGRSDEKWLNLILRKADML